MRNSAIDTLRFVAALSIVCIHFSTGPMLGVISSVFARWAVPFFFMVSGYFIPTLSRNKTHCRQHFKRLTIITLSAMALYMLLLNGTPLLTANDIIYFIAFNEPLIVQWSHLWFLWALLYASAILIWLYNHSHTLIKLLPPLILIPIILSYTDANPMYYRNWLFMGLPCMSIGTLLHENSTRLKPIANKWFFIAFAICVTLTLLHFKTIDNTSRDFGISTWLMAIIALIFATNNPTFTHNTPLERLGRNYSMPLYLFHTFVGTILLNICHNNIITIYSAWIVAPATLLLIYIFRHTRHRPSPHHQ